MKREHPCGQAANTCLKLLILLELFKTGHLLVMNRSIHKVRQAPILLYGRPLSTITLRWSEMEDDYAFALQILDQLNGVEEFTSIYYEQRASRIAECAEEMGLDSEKVFAALVAAIREDIKEHPNQERLQFLLREN